MFLPTIFAHHLLCSATEIEMRRAFLSLAAVLLSVSTIFAAEPQPLWERDTTTDKLRSLEVGWLGFSPDGKTLVARVYYATDNKDTFNSPCPTRLFAWETVTRKEKINLDFGTIDRITTHFGTCAITDDERVLVPGKRAKEVRLADGKADNLFAGPANSVSIWFDTKSRKTVCLLEHDLEVGCFAVGQLPNLDAKGERAAAEWTETRLRNYFITTAFTANPGSKHIAVASSVDDGQTRRTLRLYTITSKDELDLLAKIEGVNPHRSDINAIQFSPDGKMLAVGGGESLVTLWDVTKAGKDWTPHSIIPLGNCSVGCLAFSPDGRTLAAGTYDKKIANLYMIDIRGGKLVSSRRLTEAVSALAYSPDGKLLVTGHNAGKVQVWDAAAIRGD
jgi:WD40 repeat protein